MAGHTPKREMRVHNEGNVGTTSIEIEIHESVTVLDIAPPATGSFTTVKRGARNARVTWQVAGARATYVARPCTAKNLDSATATVRTA